MDEIILSRGLPTRQSNRSLYDRLTKSRNDNKLTDWHEELLRSLIGAAQSLALAAAADLPDQLGLFASEAANRLEHDLLLWEANDWSYPLERRIASCKWTIRESTLQHSVVVKKYKSRVLQCVKRVRGPSTFVPGDDICASFLREYIEEPFICGPIVCHLCGDTSFWRDEDFRQA